MTSLAGRLGLLWLALLGLLLLQASLAEAVFIPWENCLDPAVINSNPLQLQFIPLFYNAVFNETKSAHTLHITIYGNVSGQAVQGAYAPFDDPSWNNTNMTFGKIANIGSANKFSTLLTKADVLTYSAWNAPAAELCPALINGTCPLGPVWPQYGYANPSNPYTLPAVTIAHDFHSTYAFGTLAITTRIISGDAGAVDLLCASANVTPNLGPKLSGLLCWLPAAVLILCGISTVMAAIWSPWGSSDIFKWSSNYGRDEDLLRLVTPGFGDCLQYIQFVVLCGSLTLKYPGFFQPAVSQTSWANLMFNESFVSHGNGTDSLVDGIYFANGTYGLTRMSELVGMTAVQDIWACMAVWLCVICVAVIMLCQLAFFARWVYLKVSHTTEEDLRQKNWPFTVGNLVRIVMNFFLLPIVALSMYQLVIAPHSPAAVVAMAVVLLVAVIAFAAWCLRVIFMTKPRALLFDDLQLVLLYGPLYNTYSDSAAPFALIPAFITFMRGVAIGAVQPSGIAQIIILAICEVILILTLNAFRPFHGPTSMNAYHTFFACIRLVTVLLSVAFVPSLSVNEASKGWVGYVILLLHACVLVFGFFLNSLQTIAEVFARLWGVKSDPQRGAMRGPVVTWRDLTNRTDRPRTSDGASMTSHAAILQDIDGRSGYTGGRSRSLSASSQQLLNQHTPSVHRLSGFENFSSGGDKHTSPGTTQDGDPESGMTYAPAGQAGIQQMKEPPFGAKNDQPPPDTFFRAPRARKPTLDTVNQPGAKSRQSGASGYDSYEDSPQQSTGAKDSGGGSSDNPHRNSDSPAPAYFRDGQHNPSDSDLNRGPRTDYAVREVDQYYNFRGPALSGNATRKLKTGPADPEGPAANAQSWFQKLFGGGKKVQTKGFEVVRGSQLPPQDEEEGHEMVNSPPMSHEPYQDFPEPTQGEYQAVAGAERGLELPAANPSVSHEDFTLREDIARRSVTGLDGTMDTPLAGPVSPIVMSSLGESDHSTPAHGYQQHSGGAQFVSPQPSVSRTYNHPSTRFPELKAERLSDVPSLAPIEGVGGGLDVGSRFGSQRSNMSEVSRDTRNTDDDTHFGAGSRPAWLSDMDAATRGWDHRRTSGNTIASPTSPLSLASTVPHGNSRRNVSQEGARGFSGGSRSHTQFPAPGDALGLPQQNHRPTSTGYVQHHVAGDQVRAGGTSANLEPSQAEWVSRADSFTHDRERFQL